ncbi:MAG: hypothetical protein LCH92_02970 [Proteobacteria bacterium]|nr:hypothetical protein [Pseudomonadota bacterium]
MKRAVVLGILLGVPGWAGAQQGAPDLVAYGSRAGMEVTILSRQGIDSAAAEVRVAHTPENARAFCTLYVMDPSEACVTATLADVAGWVGDRIAGDCTAGVFTGLWGGRMRFLGRLPARSEFGAEWDFREEGSDTPLDGTTASGYGVVLDQFRSICPARLAEG